MVTKPYLHPWSLTWFTWKSASGNGEFRLWKSSFSKWLLPKTGGIPENTPKWSFLVGKTHGCWVPPPSKWGDPPAWLGRSWPQLLQVCHVSLRSCAEKPSLAGLLPLRRCYLAASLGWEKVVPIPETNGLQRVRTWKWMVRVVGWLDHST